MECSLRALWLLRLDGTVFLSRRYPTVERRARRAATTADAQNAYVPIPRDAAFEDLARRELLPALESDGVNGPSCAVRSLRVPTGPAERRRKREKNRLLSPSLPPRSGNGNDGEEEEDDDLLVPQLPPPPDDAAIDAWLDATFSNAEAAEEEEEEVPAGEEPDASSLLAPLAVVRALDFLIVCLPLAPALDTIATMAAVELPCITAAYEFIRGVVAMLLPHYTSASSTAISSPKRAAPRRKHHQGARSTTGLRSGRKRDEGAESLWWFDERGIAGELQQLLAAAVPFGTPICTDPHVLRMALLDGGAGPSHEGGVRATTTVPTAAAGRVNAAAAAALGDAAVAAAEADETDDAGEEERLRVENEKKIPNSKKERTGDERNERDVGAIAARALALAKPTRRVTFASAAAVFPQKRPPWRPFVAPPPSVLRRVGDAIAAAVTATVASSVASTATGSGSGFLTSASVRSGGGGGGGATHGGGSATTGHRGPNLNTAALFGYSGGGGSSDSNSSRSRRSSWSRTKRSGQSSGSGGGARLEIVVREQIRSVQYGGSFATQQQRQRVDTWQVNGVIECELHSYSGFDQHGIVPTLTIPLRLHPRGGGASSSARGAVADERLKTEPPTAVNKSRNIELISKLKLDAQWERTVAAFVVGECVALPPDCLGSSAPRELVLTPPIGKFDICRYSTNALGVLAEPPLLGSYEMEIISPHEVRLTLRLSLSPLAPPEIGTSLESISVEIPFLQMALIESHALVASSGVVRRKSSVSKSKSNEDGGEFL